VTTDDDLTHVDQALALLLFELRDLFFQLGGEDLESRLYDFSSASAKMIDPDIRMPSKEAFALLMRRGLVI
jgi:hypothetical protein